MGEDNKYVFTNKAKIIMHQVFLAGFQSLMCLNEANVKCMGLHDVEGA